MELLQHLILLWLLGRLLVEREDVYKNLGVRLPILLGNAALID